MRVFKTFCLVLAFILVGLGLTSFFVSGQAPNGAVVPAGGGVAASVEGLYSSGGSLSKPLMLGLYSAGAVIYLKDTYGLADAASGSGFPATVPWIWNGASYDKQYGCSASAAVALTASGSTQIIALDGTKVIRICSLIMAGDTSVNVKLVRGTGTNCATSPTDMTGLFYNATSVSLDFPTPNSGLKGGAGQAICVNLSGTANWGGVVTYAQF